ncbi:hypothetical protein CA54_59650 [Symmachiella macrocystis]|uniref:FHA domain-containing protein n=1 Tax=Symmachiella macrocystis TaxID=2527985 RepID=A0A5C6B0H5_9PLAN|nr:FHA domain-containing protein [Symmachiella macrocystis]TWU05277.1 hypothetical protein CA54_59650 [Symmachiella macrocystis]
MAFRVATEAGAIIEIEGTSAVIGRDRFCAIAFPDDERLCGQHATIKRVAGRWMIESQGDHLLTAGNAPSARVHWLQPGDSIGLTETGPKLVFEPAEPATTPLPPAVPVAAAAPANDKVEQAVTPVSSGDVGAPQNADESPAFSPKQLAVWGVGGLAVVLVVAFTLLSRNSGGGDQRVVVTEAPENTPEEPQLSVVAEHGSEPIDKNGPGISPTPLPKNPAAPSATQALYAIVIKSPGGQMNQLGTAFAISPHRLATTASAIEAARKLCTPTSGMTALLISPTIKREILIDFDKTKVHPEFANAMTQLGQIIPQLEALDEKKEQAADESERNTIDEQMQPLEEKAYQISEEGFYFDIGAIEVTDELENYLSLIETADRPSTSSKIVLQGCPVKTADFMWDPEEPPIPSQSAGRILMLLPQSPSGTVEQLVLKCEGDFSGFEWFGSPVLAKDGKVIGVYVRRTPLPPGATGTDQVEVTHDAVGIGLLNNL